MKKRLFVMSLSGVLFGALLSGAAAGAEPAAPLNSAASEVLRFEIKRYVLEGATLLTTEEVIAAVLPFVGKGKDFSDVQHALEAVEELYAKHGYTAVHVLLPEQELEKGTVRFRVVESRFGKVEVKDNRYFSKDSVLNALPSIRTGWVPRSSQIARELKLANENPARLLNVVLKAGEKEEQVDATVMVTDSKPASWSASLDNSGSYETGSTRAGLSYRNANMFEADHVASIQYLVSPQHPDRARVIGGSYKIPLYEKGISVEVFAGYSNVNALVGGLSNFQGGGVLFSARYNIGLERIGAFDPRLSFGLDWRKFRNLELANTPPTVLYKEIVVLPLSATYAVQGKFDRSDLNANVSYSVNVPKVAKGRKEDFAAYDQLNFTQPKPAYKVVRYGMNYLQQVGSDWQFRAAANGQWSRDVLVQGEQIRLGGADAVRGFSEGSEGGEKGARMNLEGYTPDFGMGDFRARTLIFYDAGAVTPTNGKKTAIAGAGIGLRINYSEHLTMRVDRAQIRKAGTDTNQRVGDWRWHAALTATF